VPIQSSATGGVVVRTGGSLRLADMNGRVLTAEPLPYLTADHPGIGGVIKRFDEDFIVEELPLYSPCGAGTHAYFTIEKRGHTTLDAIRIVAGRLGRKRQEIGYAGLKDAHGVTRQTFSLEHVDPATVAALSFDRIKILGVTRHTNKLKLGHLAGNRFEIRIRDVARAATERAVAILELLSHRGVPNYFGPQRFGVRGDNAAIGVAVLRNDYETAIAHILGRPGPVDHGAIRRARELFDAGDIEGAAAAWPGRGFAPQARICRALIGGGGDARNAWRAVDHTLRRLYLSAVQSELFNRVLVGRIGTIDRLIDGDIAWIHRNGACFEVLDVAHEQPRCSAFEISPTGPLFGRRMKEPAGDAGRLEAEALENAALNKDQFRATGAGKLNGARRPLRVPLGGGGAEAGSDQRGPYLRLRFELPAGAYATNVSREICKVDRLEAE